MRAFLKASTALAVLLPVVPAAAQDSAAADTRAVQGADDGVIIVTAQKRSENLQDVPIAVTVIGGEALQAAQINDVLDLQSAAPSLQVSAVFGTARVFIRGIGLTNFAGGAESSVAFHVNGAVVSRPSAQIGSFYDLERIEVLRGPQGSLYGRNATGGSLNIITRRPTRDVEGYGEFTVGNYGQIGLEGAVSGPIIKDQLLARVAFTTENRNGFGRNIFRNEDIDNADTEALRASLDYVGIEGFKAAFTYSHYQSADGAGANHSFGPGNPLVLPPELLLGGRLAPNIRDINSEAPVQTRKNLDSLTFEATVELSDAVSLKSLTSYLDQDLVSIQDLNGTPVQYFRGDVTEFSDQFSQELQLTADTGPVSTLVGLYYFKENIAAENNIQGPTVFSDVFRRPLTVFNGDLDSKSYAAFVNSTVKLSDQLSVTGGLRYSSDRKSDVGFLLAPTGAIVPLARQAKWHAWTPKLTVEYSPSRDTLVYGTISRGYKTGVINIGNPGAAVNPEYVWNYEAGLKTELFDRRVTVNLAAFYAEITDLQVQRPINGNLITVNAAKASTKGLELETTARLGGGFVLHLNGAYVDASYSDFLTANTTFTPVGGADIPLNLAGNQLTNAPKWQGELALAYGTDFSNGWTLKARAQGLYASKRYFNEFNEAIAFQGETFNLNANIRIGSPDDRFYLNFWGRNLTDQFAFSHISVSSRPVGHMRNGNLLPPRTYGATLGFKF